MDGGGVDSIPSPLPLVLIDAHGMINLRGSGGIYYTPFIRINRISLWILNLIFDLYCLDMYKCIKTVLGYLCETDDEKKYKSASSPSALVWKWQICCSIFGHKMFLPCISSDRWIRSPKLKSILFDIFITGYYISDRKSEQVELKKN